MGPPSALCTQEKIDNFNLPQLPGLAPDQAQCQAQGRQKDNVPSTLRLPWVPRSAHPPHVPTPLTDPSVFTASKCFPICSFSIPTCLLVHWLKFPKYLWHTVSPSEQPGPKRPRLPAPCYLHMPSLPIKAALSLVSSVTQRALCKSQGCYQNIDRQCINNKLLKTKDAYQAGLISTLTQVQFFSITP